MKNRYWHVSWLALGLAALPAGSQAHFRLLAPASWLVENQLGDPQKAAPCGGTNASAMVYRAWQLAHSMIMPLAPRFYASVSAQTVYRPIPTHLSGFLDPHLSAAEEPLRPGEVGLDPAPKSCLSLLTLSLIEEVRRTWQFYRDRRPDTYEDMVKQLP